MSVDTPLDDAYAAVAMRTVGLLRELTALALEETSGESPDAHAALMHLVDTVGAYNPSTTLRHVGSDLVTLAVALRNSGAPAAARIAMRCGIAALQMQAPETPHDAAPDFLPEAFGTCDTGDDFASAFRNRPNLN